MKSEFKEYYAPDAADYGALVKTGLIVLDANVLLDLYRLPRTTAEALLSTLEKIKGRVWIPYNVGLEYQRNRLDAIVQSKKRLDDLLAKGKKHLAEIEREVLGLEFDKRGMESEANHLVDAVRVASTQLEALASRAKQDQISAGLKDPLRDKLDELLAGRVGDRPQDQEWLESLYLEGEKRYAARLPPGYGDAKKAGLTHEGGLTYKLQYGDLVLWRQLLMHVRASSASQVVLVTNDSKPDWWTEVEGRTVGPHPQLIEEMRRVGGATSFWIYNLAQFIEQARIHVDSRIPEKVVSDVKDAEASLIDDWHDAFADDLNGDFWTGDGRAILLSVVQPYMTAGWRLEAVFSDPLAVVAVDAVGRKTYVSADRVTPKISRASLLTLLEGAVEIGGGYGVDFMDVVLVASSVDNARRLRSRLLDDLGLFTERVRALGIRSLRLGLVDGSGDFHQFWSHLANLDHPPP